MGRTLYSIGFICLVCWAQIAQAQDKNVFEDVIQAESNIEAHADINVTSGTLRAADGLFYALEVRDATDWDNRIKMGGPGQGQVQIYVSTWNGSYRCNIQSTTDIPLFLYTPSRQTQIQAGADISGGTTRVDQQLDVTNGHLQVINATGVSVSLRFTRSATDEEGFAGYLDVANRRVIMHNTQSDNNGWYFEPPLSNIGDASDPITIYANHITMDVTDSTQLPVHLVTLANSISWDNLLDSVSATTIVDYVSSASNWILTNFDVLENATGENIVDYIDDRFTSLVRYVTDMIIENATFTNVNITDAILQDIAIENLLLASGTINFSSVTNFIGWPSSSPDLTGVNASLDALSALYSYLATRVVNLEQKQSSITTPASVVVQLYEVGAATNEIFARIALPTGYEVHSVFSAQIAGFHFEPDAFGIISSSTLASTSEYIFSRQPGMQFEQGDSGTITVLLQELD